LPDQIGTRDDPCEFAIIGQDHDGVYYSTCHVIDHRTQFVIELNGDQLGCHGIFEGELVVEERSQHAIVAAVDVVHQFQNVGRRDHSNRDLSFDNWDVMEAPVLEKCVHLRQWLPERNGLGVAGHNFGQLWFVLHVPRLARDVPLWQGRRSLQVDRSRLDRYRTAAEICPPGSPVRSPGN
jgi:hypothetical protein